MMQLPLFCLNPPGSGLWMQGIRLVGLPDITLNFGISFQDLGLRHLKREARALEHNNPHALR